MSQPIASAIFEFLHRNDANHDPMTATLPGDLPFKVKLINITSFFVRNTTENPPTSIKNQTKN